MPRINLLPWREQERKVRRREFVVALGGAAFAAAIFVVGGALLYNSWIDGQNAKNNLLKKEIVKLDAQIADIQDLENRKQRLVARMEIIEKLQRKRPEIVHLFDELVKTIPASARLGGLKQSGDSMTLEGVAQSNASVADYMRNIEASPWMGHADLRKTENTHGDSRMPYTFGLDVALSRPKSDDQDPDKTPIMPAAASTSAAPAAKPPLPAAATAPVSTPASAPAAAAPAKPATATKPAAAQPAGGKA